MNKHAPHLQSTAWQIVILMIICVFSACSASKNAQRNVSEELTIDQLDAYILADTLAFRTFTAKAKMHVAGPMGEQNVNAHIEIEKDAFIGISLRVLGIEGAKIYITPDSVKILDRINQKYYPRDYAYIEKMFSVKADFAMLQALFTGDVFYYEGTKYPLAADTCNCYKLMAQNGNIKNTIFLLPSFHIQQMFVEDMSSRRTMLLSYSDYRKLENENFSFLRTVDIDAVEKYNLRMEFTDVILNGPLQFTFSVNSKYEKVE